MNRFLYKSVVCFFFVVFFFVGGVGPAKPCLTTKLKTLYQTLKATTPMSNIPITTPESHKKTNQQIFMHLHLKTPANRPGTSTLHVCAKRFAYEQYNFEYKSTKCHLSLLQKKKLAFKDKVTGRQTDCLYSFKRQLYMKKKKNTQFIAC